MTANLELQRVKEWGGLRGFANLFHKENRAWWGTRRWWINALLWSVLLDGLILVIMLFAPSEGPNQATEAKIAQAGAQIFFQFGASILAIGTVILAQDLILGEKQNGVVEWLLSKPVVRRSYVLAKLAANALPELVLLVGLPSILAYGMFSLRTGVPFPLAPFLSAVGIMTVHSLFYLTLTLMLGTIFNNRAAILGIALGSALGGNILGGLVNPLFYVTPWVLPNVALSTATSQAIPVEMGLASLIATVLWSLVFILVALWKFEKTEL